MARQTIEFCTLFTKVESAGNLVGVDQFEPEANRARSSRAWFSASIEEFRRTYTETILGHIAKYAEYDVVLTQRNTWLAQIEILRSALSELNGDIFFEFTVPRLGRRIDVVLLIGATVLR